MDFKDSLRQISSRVEKLGGKLQTEEATKNALVMPFIQILGYDVFDPHEIIPEFVCDIGIKKGEKIDYAIMKDDAPIVLIECKKYGENLNLHDGQLLRYFHASRSKFGVLTDGNIYKFYTDLVEHNKMDEKPFLEINMLELDDAHIEELKKFHKSYFNIDEILDSASDLKYTGELKAVIAKEFSEPTPEFVKYFGKQVYDGVFTQKMLEQFTSLVKRSIAAHINDTISNRLKVAIKAEEVIAKEDIKAEEVAEDKNEDKIVITSEMLECFYITKSILRGTIDSERIIYRGAQSYFGIFIDNSKKPICRLYLNSASNKMLALIGENKKEIRNKIENIDGIYNYSAQLIEAVKKFL